jgi:hypothetical protein
MTDENYRVEYSTAQATYLHYDAFRWQAGSFLIAGVFVFWGLLIQNPLKGPVIATGALLVALLMSTWILFAHHYRQIYLAKLHRIREIEDLLGLKQHTRFDRSRDNSYQLFGPRGHTLDIAVYVFVSLGGVLLGAVRSGPSWWLLLPVPIVLITVAGVLRNERRVVNALARRTDKALGAAESTNSAATARPASGG